MSQCSYERNLLLKQPRFKIRPQRSFLQLQVVLLALIFLNLYGTCHLHVHHIQQIQWVPFICRCSFITKSSGTGIACNNAIVDRIMVASLHYPACFAVRNNIVMEFKVVSCTWCSPYATIVGTVHQAITHRITMAGSTFCIPENNRVLAMVKNTMVQHEAIAISNSGYTYR